MHPRHHLPFAWILSIAVPLGVAAQSLEDELKSIGAPNLVEAARELGDARRGAVVFYQPQLACTRCHIPDKAMERLGPDLTKLDKDASDVHLVESILEPSKAIRDGFEPVTLVTREGAVATGLLVSSSDTEVTIRDAGQNFKTVKFEKAQLASLEKGQVSVMPAGQINLLTSRQQFLDLVRYLIEIRDGGSARARELEPAPSLYAARPLPEYEQHVDHAGIIASLDQDAFRRGERIYNRLCVNCHGTHDQPGSLPTSLRFASGHFKNGHDPFTMYQTLTKGFGLMVAQTWMVPTQKYDVIHYIREAYLKDHNPSQYLEIDKGYLDRLPKGDTRGPPPSNIVPWVQMDYGPNLVMTLEIGDDATNFAYKGNAIRLDAGPGGVSQGRYWMVYDYDTLRVAAAWSGEGFCDWNGINFNGRHAIHPRLVGDVHLANPTGPGWGRPGVGSFEEVRLVGRDGRRYGPLPRTWAHYKGMYYHGPRTLVEYTVGATRVLELPGVLTSTPAAVFTRTFNIGPRDEDLLLQVAHRDEPDIELVELPRFVAQSAVLFGVSPRKDRDVPASAARGVSFNGGTRLEAGHPEHLDLHRSDFTVTARVRTKKDGTILARTESGDEWRPNGMTWFIRGGRLTLDIGWVGAFSGDRRVSDGEWHHVAFSYENRTGAIQFYVDGRPERRQGRLKPKASIEEPVIRIGYTSDDFPEDSGFDGEISEVRVYERVLAREEVAAVAAAKEVALTELAARWEITTAVDGVVPDRTGHQHDCRVLVGTAAPSSSQPRGWTVAGLAGGSGGARWLADGGDLHLRIPAGDEHLRFTLWFASVTERDSGAALVDAIVFDEPERDLTAFTRGGPSRWPQVIKTEAVLGSDDGPFAVDVLTHPEVNPWFCRMRLTGFDFLPGGDQMVISAWDGSIWLVSGLGQLPSTTPTGDARRVELTWRRIGSGLFQPLGVKFVGGKVYVTCRDELAVLHDLNGDGEIDHFENFNNDHQVTDHFHEFAMGLQVDDEGNFYYAKSARHALPALVPHHGTLLRVSKDGSRTDILATGFRAANGVCLNTDGTFIVTDQEGHWNPKNRINYVKIGGFYGNMFGYHDVTDSSDDAMEQPLCWITNSFDRSPAELLWVKSERWGPLNGQLLNLSYGYGEVYVVPHEKIDGQAQGGMCSFPIGRLPTGIIRGRFHPGDGQLYVCGMFAWAGSQTQSGGLYRIRYTGKPVHLPIGLNATTKGMTIVFGGELDPESASDAENYGVKIWGLKRTANYGSKHYGEHSLEVAGARVDADRRTVHLDIPEIQPTWCMEILYRIRSAEGKPIDGRIHNTIHKLRDSRTTGAAHR